METNLLEKPVRKPGLLYKKLDDEGILFDKESNVVHLLNATSELIWNCCDGRHDVGKITAKIMKRYAVEKDRAEQDVTTTLGQLRNLGLLEA